MHTILPPPPQALSQDENLYKRLVASFAPNIWEMDDVKKGMLCQLFGGMSKVGVFLLLLG